jgi:molybdopterin-guanine dinucleotide biosynthesis protein
MSGDVFAFEDDALVAQPYAADVSSVSSAFSAAAFDAVIVEGFGESTGDLALNVRCLRQNLNLRSHSRAHRTWSRCR